MNGKLTPFKSETEYLDITKNPLIFIFRDYNFKGKKKN